MNKNTTTTTPNAEAKAPATATTPATIAATTTAPVNTTATTPPAPATGTTNTTAPASGTSAAGLPENYCSGGSLTDAEGIILPEYVGATAEKLAKGIQPLSASAFYGAFLKSCKDLRKKKVPYTAQKNAVMGMTTQAKKLVYHKRRAEKRNPNNNTIKGNCLYDKFTFSRQTRRVSIMTSIISRRYHDELRMNERLHFIGNKVKPQGIAGTDQIITTSYRIDSLWSFSFILWYLFRQ